MNGIELLQILINLYNEVVMDGVKSDSWTTKLDKLNLADSELVINEDEAIRQEFLEWVAMKQRLSLCGSPHLANYAMR